MSQVQRDASHAASAWWRHPGWYRALTLAERAASLYGTTTAPAQGGVWANKQAEQTLQQWKAQAPFQAGTAFADRLAMEGLTEHDLLQLLAEPLEALQSRLPLPEWVNTFLRAIEEPASSAAVPVLEADARTPIAFLPLLQPLLASAQQRLCLGLEDLAWHYRHLPFKTQPVLTSLVAELARRLLFQASRTLALELKVAGLLGQLTGQTPQERFQHFLQRLSQREALLTLFEEYSVLARQLVLTCDHWVASSLEVLRRLCADWDEIRATFSPESDPGLLIEVQSGAGDLHREGRSVLLLKFRSGFQVVYKPKLLAIDVHFQELLQWLNQHGAEPGFQMVKVIDKGTYGWSAWVQARDCTSQEEVQRFYERQGAYLALLNVLDATDFHYENLIASGEYPVLIDLETLFHPRIAGEDTLFAGALAHEALAHSVYQIGLLPQRSWGNDEAEGVNMSGLGGPEGQLTPRAVPRWEAAGTDQMRLERRRVELPAARNLPRLNGQQIDTFDYRGALMAGFKQMYSLLQDQRDALVAQWLPRFAQDEIRFIARPTDIYARFLYDSFRPELLRDALERERHFDRLWLGIQWQPSMSRLIPAERADLLRGDVPFFTTRPDSRDLYTSRGEIIPEFFPQSSLNVVRKRLKCLSSSDLTQQLWIINAAFTVSALNTQGLPRKPLHLESSLGVPHTHLLREAQTFGELIARNALWSAQAVGWLGVSPKNEQEWELLPAGLDLYNGLPGIMFFLAYLERLTGDQHALDLAQATLSSIQTLLKHPNHQQTLEGIGAFDGWGGVLYLYSHLGRLWKKPALFQEAEAIVERLADLIEQDHSYDIIAGSAGCICALLSLYAVAPSPPTLKAAIHCGDHLVATAQPMKAGIGWIIPRQERPLTGFAHGNAGIALSLLRLAAVSGEERFKEAARSALAYERSLYAPAQHNWPDLRKLRASSRRTQVEEAETQRFMVAWCHGAAGIALARLASAAYLDDALLHEEIAAALQTTLDQGFWVRHNLCHGGFGNLETLLVASRTGEWPDLQQRVQQIAGALLESLGSADQPNDGVLDIASPGLMTGGAGVGYQLLRLAAPERVPSVLLLEPP